MIEFQQDNQFFLFQCDVPKQNQSQLFEPEFWQSEGRIIGTAKGRGTTYFLKTADLFGTDCALRHYYRGGFIGKFNRDRYAFRHLDETRSFAEFKLLNQLHQAGIPVPKPIAARIQKGKFCICYQADILVQKIENAQDLTALLQHSSLSEKTWRQIGNIIRQLHNQQICHSDLNAHNILVQTNENEQKCWLIDFDKCGQKSGDFWKNANLERLHRSFIKETERMGILFSHQDWEWLMEGYGSA